MLVFLLGLLIDIADIFDEMVPGIGTIIVLVINVIYNYKQAGWKWALIAALESPIPLLDIIPSATLARMLRHSKFITTIILIIIIILFISVVFLGYKVGSFIGVF